MMAVFKEVVDKIKEANITKTQEALKLMGDLKSQYGGKRKQNIKYVFKKFF
jgi:hypothetical protein